MEHTQKNLWQSFWTSILLKKEEKGALEKAAYEKNIKILGVDEVGRGCLAGSVYAAALVLDLRKLFTLSDKERNLIRDSKKLSPKQRALSIEIIKKISLDESIGISSEREIEKYGIVEATFIAMTRAIQAIKSPVDKIYVDGNQTISGFNKIPQEAIIKGDSLSYTIAAASIIAKEARDLYMQKQALAYPGYGFENHVGYGTKAHLEALEKLGITSIHRKNFAPIRDMI